MRDVQLGSVWRWIERNPLLVGASLLAAAGAIFLVVPRSERVALIGDSLAVGLGPPLTTLAQADSVPFKFEGAVGTTAAQWASSSSACGQCGSWLSLFNPTKVLVSLGTNDLGLSTSGLEAQRPNYNSIIKTISSLGAEPVWIEPPGTDSRLANVKAFIHSLNVRVLSNPSRIPISADGIHPSNYSFWAKALWIQV